VALPSGLFPPGFSTTSLYATPLCPVRATCHAHLIALDLLSHVIFGDEYRLPQSPAASFRFSPDVFLVTTLSLCSYLSVTDQV
jgi:hypothetical protein